jgi:hypothetical protein
MFCTLVLFLRNNNINDINIITKKVDINVYVSNIQTSLFFSETILKSSILLDLSVFIIKYILFYIYFNLLFNYLFYLLNYTNNK